MPRKQGHERCHGPFKHGNRWRVVIVGADGSREFAKESDDGPRSFATEAAALDYIRAFRGAAEGRTVGEAVTAYVEARSTGKHTTDDKTRYALEGMLRTRDGEKLLTTLKPATATALVKRRTAEVKFETLRVELGYAVRFCRWCVDQGWLRINPFDAVELRTPKEGRSRGKPQLRVDEVRRFVRVLLTDQTTESTAVLMAVLMGLRAHEVVERTVRDLDDNCRLLVIGKSKTKAGERTVMIPAVLRDRLRDLARGHGPDEKLFRTPTNPRKATSCTRHWLHYWAVQFSELAGVPRVTPHGLRGTFATMMVAANLPGATGGQHPMTVSEVATTLGHTSPEVTRRHYMAPGAEQSAGISAVEVLLGTDSSEAFPEDSNEEGN